MRSVLLPCLLSAFIATTVLAAPPQYSARKDIATGFLYLNNLAVADFNGDGKPDLVVSDNRGKNIQVYLNRGNGAFSDPITTIIADPNVSGGPLITGDFDEDGKQDLIVGPTPAVTGSYSLDPFFFSGNGDGTFTFRSRITGMGSLTSAIAADTNKDSHLDLIGGTTSLSVARGDGHGSFTVQQYGFVPGFIQGLAASDFTDDSYTDITLGLSSTSQPGSILTFFGTSLGGFQPQLSGIAMLGPKTLATTDFNADGKPDLLVGGTGYANILLNGIGGNVAGNGVHTLPIPQPTTVATAFSAVGDFNNDQKPDVVVADTGSNTLNLFLNDGTGTFPQTTPDFSTDLPKYVGQLRTADFNGDGISDVIVTNYENQNISVYLSQTTPTLSLTSNSSSVFTGSSITITTKTKPASSTATPTGTVTLMDGATSLAQQTLDSSGQATFTLSNLTTGQHSITASYSGDTNFTPPPALRSTNPSQTSRSPYPLLRRP